MFAIVALILFGIGTIISAFGLSVPSELAPHTLILAGLFFLTLHLMGLGAAYAPWRRAGTVPPA
jgi:Na+/phosphate symporter